VGAPDPFGIAALRALVPHAASRAPEVSAWSVGRQVEHCALAMEGIGEALLASTPPPPRAGLALTQRLVLLAGWLPRGRARAPESVVPTAEPDPGALERHLSAAEELLRRVARADRGLWFRHFVLGVMDRDRALRFLAVHNRHHGKIARDVLRRAESRGRG